MKIDINPEIVEEAIAEIGIGFLFAPIITVPCGLRQTREKKLACALYLICWAL